MSDTSETDDLASGNHVVRTEFARKLERERNEARDELKIALEQWKLCLEQIAKLKNAN